MKSHCAASNAMKFLMHFSTLDAPHYTLSSNISTMM